MLHQLLHLSHTDNCSVSNESRMRWLRSSEQLDILSPELVKAVSLRVHHTQSDCEKAVALHNFVKSMPFAWVDDFSRHTASGVLKLGHGDCLTKGMLMVALLRTAKVPARLRFVALSSRVWRGMVEMDQETTMHVFAQVLLDGRWIFTDSYVIDAALQRAAQARLDAEQQSVGYGIHRQGSMFWDGQHDASVLCLADDASSLPVKDWGVADDPRGFYAQRRHTHLKLNLAQRLKWRLFVPVVNRRIAHLRSEALAAYGETLPMPR